MRHNITMRRVAGMLHYRGLLVLDQVLFSATNFILTITLARVYSDVALAAFGVGLASALIVQQFQRNLYISRFSLLTARASQRYLPGIAAEHLIIIAALSLLSLLWALGAVLFGLGAYLVDIAFCTLICSLIYFQVEFDRAVQIKRGSAWGAFLLSMLYFCVVLGISGLAFYARLPFELFLAGLAAFSVAKCFWLAFFVTRLRWHWGWHFLREDMRRYGVSAGMYAVTSAGVVHVPVMVLAAVSAPAQVAALVAMRSLTQPLQLIVRSFDAAERNRFRAMSGGTVAGARRCFWRMFSLYAGVGVIGLLLVALAPNAIIHLAYRGRFPDSAGLLLGWCAYATVLGITASHMVVVRILHKDNEIILWLVASAILATTAAFLLCSRDGATGALIGTLAGAALTAFGGIVTIRQVAFGGGNGPLPSERRPRTRTATRLASAADAEQAEPT